MRRLSPFVVGIVATTVLLVSLPACGGGGDRDAEVPAEEKTPVGEITTADGEAQRAADAAVLTIEDFPAGWVETEPSEDDESDPCKTRKIVEEKEIAGAESMDFEKADAFVTNVVSVFASAESADEVISEVTDRFRQCDPDAIREAWQEDAPKGVTAEDVEIGRLSFPELADRTEALRLTLTIAGELDGESTLDVPWDFVFVRSGRMVSVIYAMELFSLGDGVSQEMAELAAEKLEQAAAQLTGRPVATTVEASPAAETVVQPQPTDTPLPPEPTEERAERIVTAAPGAVAEAEGVQITLNEIIDSWVSSAEFAPDRPDPGKRFVVFDVTIQYVRERGTHFACGFGFRLTDADAFAYDIEFLFDLEPSLDCIDLGGGEKTRGWIGFEVNEGAVLELLKYDPDPFTTDDIEFRFR